MTFGQVTRLAASYIGEDADALDFEELGRRVPPLLQSAVNELIPLDMILTGKQEQAYNDIGDVNDENGVLPFGSACCTLCALRLAILLVCDENTELAAFLNTEYVRVKSEALGALGATVETVVNVYRD